MSTLIHTPDSVRAIVERAKAYIVTLNADVERRPGQAAALGWRPFFDEFNSWLASDPSFYWGSTYDDAEGYIARAVEYRKRLIAAGGDTTTPVDPTPPEKPSDAGAWTALAALVVIVLALAYVLGPGTVGRMAA